MFTKLFIYKFLNILIVLNSILFSDVLLTEHEKLWLKKHPEITLGVDNRFKPMNYSNDNNELKGLNIDIVRLIEKKIGFNFQYEAAPWPEVFSKAMNHELDGIINADKTPEREEMLIFTDVFAHHPMAIYTNKDNKNKLTLNNIAEKSVGVKSQTSISRYLHKNYPNAKIIEFDNINDALLKLSSKEIDAVCDWYAVLDKGVKELFFENIIPTDVFLCESSGHIRIGIRKDYPELVYVLNRAIADISDEERDSIFSKWITPDIVTSIDYLVIWNIVLVALFIIALFFFWNMKLSQEIKKRTVTENELEATINKLKVTEEQINTFSNRLAIALKSSKAGIWDYNIKENILIWDDRMFELYGNKREDFTSEYEAWQQGVHPDDRDKASKEIDMAIAGEKEFDTVFRVLWPDNSIHFIKANAKLMRDSDNNPSRLIGVNFDITDQKNAEEKLLLSEQRLRQVQNIAGIGYWDLDIENGELEWSDEVFKIFGIKKHKDKILLRDFINRIHSDDRDLVMNTYKDSIENKYKYEIMHRIVQEDYGEVRYVVQHCEHTFDEQGNAVRSLGTVHDITGQILLEEEKKNFFDMSQDFVGIAEFNAHFRFVNKAFLDVLGYSEKELKEKTFFDFIHPDDHKKTGDAMSVLLKGEQVTDFENRYITKNGEVRWLSWRANPDLEKGFIYYIARDVTYSKIADNELRKNREQLRTIIDSVSSLIFMKDVNGYFLIVNKAYERTIGVSIEDVLGKTEYDIFPKNIADPIVEMDKKIIENRDMVTYEEDVRLKDGLIHNFITTKVPLFNDDGTVYGLVGMAVDITSRKKMEQELLHAKNVAEESYRAKSEFLANMSHEIRTPLNAVTGFSELLSTMVKDEKQKTYLNSIKTAGKALLHLINDVLDLSKLEAGKLQLTKEFFNIKDLVTEISDIFYLDLKRKEIAFNSNISKNIPDLISLDLGRLRQVLLNLVGNAVKFTNEGEIRILIESQINHDQEDILNLNIKIQDTGIGIHAKDQSSIFENFKQQSGQDNRKYGGTGLGLSICKKLVELMDGSISVESNYGKGSTFIVDIPVCEYKNDSENENYKNHQFITTLGNIQFENRMIWIVDDTNSSRILVEEMLKNVGLEYRSFDNGLSLLEALNNSEKPFLIISDIRMPKMNGVELLKKIRKIYNENELPIIALSATGTTEYSDKLMVSKFNAFLNKPVELNDFYNVLKDFIPIKTIHNELYNDDIIEEAVHDELISFLSDDFYIAICNLNMKAGLKMAEVMKAGELLLNKALHYNSEIVSTFAQTIIDAADNMDIVYIKALKNKTENLIKNIRGE